MKKLSEILGTIYLTNDYIADIEYMVSFVRENRPCPRDIYAVGIRDAVDEFLVEGKISLDLAGTRFTDRVWSVLSDKVSQYPNLFEIIDSEDEERNLFLTVMQQEIRNGTPETIELPPKPINMLAFPGYVESLSTTEVYDVTGYADHPEFITLIQLMCPDVKIKANYRRLFEYIQKRFAEVLVRESQSFTYIPAKVDNFWHAEVDENGEVHVVNIGNMSKADFLRRYTCIPAEIGSKMYTLQDYSDLWRRAVEDVIRDVVAFLGERPNIIANYFTEEIE